MGFCTSGSCAAVATAGPGHAPTSRRLPRPTCGLPPVRGLPFWALLPGRPSVGPSAWPLSLCVPASLLSGNRAFRCAEGPRSALLGRGVSRRVLAFREPPAVDEHRGGCIGILVFNLRFPSRVREHPSGKGPPCSPASQPQQSWSGALGPHGSGVHPSARGKKTLCTRPGQGHLVWLSSLILWHPGQLFCTLPPN